ncbi:unnamed protein product [Mytilus edulis]|uniref:PHD-type domain-containing protein n=1 Tax=Mytilus edulis TaxID=6550 RepID=A0A8S3R4Z8_MYTED|nr:unnamed protein product [Mytilus edulis]
MGIAMVLLLFGKWMDEETGTSSLQDHSSKRSVFATVLQIQRYVHLYLNTTQHGSKKHWNIAIIQNPPSHILIRILLIISGIEQNPGPVQNSCGICRKLVKRNDKAIQCDECDLWIHTRCTSVDNTTYTKLQNTNDQWFCQNCVAPCGICSGNIHNCDPAIECDRCKTWIHNSCAIVSNDEYKNIQATNCTWICPLCDETNLSTSYSSTSSGIEINNIFDTLRNNKETHTCSRHIYTSKITMVSININGLRGKKLELQAYLQTENPDIVALQETKINNSIATNELIPDTLGYDIYRNDRTGNGGGTMLLVKTHLDSAPVKILENGSESIWSKIVLQGKQHYIGSWYRPPDAPLDQIQLLKDQMDKIKKLGKANKQPCIHILGDFNYRKINWRTKLNKDTNTCLNGSDGQALIDILNEASAEQLILFPTRESNTLDLLITTLPGQFTDIHSPDRLSDHDIVMGTLRCTIPRKIRPERTSYQYSKGNYNQMRDDSRDFTRDKYFNGHQNNRNVEENWIMIKEFILGTTKINVPTKILKGKQSIPWINKNIKTMIKRKNRTHANYKRNNSMRIKRKWQELRRNINKEIELAHNNYVNNLIGDIKQDSKPFWKYINNQKADKQGIPPLKTHDNKTADTDQQKAEALNTQFTSVYTETKYESVPYQTPPVDKMINIIVTTKGVEKILKNINASKAMGPDGIHPRVLKELAPNISEFTRTLVSEKLKSVTQKLDLTNNDIHRRIKIQAIDINEVKCMDFILITVQ